MKKEIILNVSQSETRIAIREDGLLVETYVERPENERMVGDIYKGQVENIISAIQAAFIDIGLKQNGFLSFADTGNELIALAERVGDDDKKKKSVKGKYGKGFPLKSGEYMLVQVIKEPIGSKGTRLTSSISLPGRFVVLVPQDNAIGVSRKISDGRERRRLRMLAKSLKPEGFGIIVRTVAVDKDAQTIKADIEHLLKLWQRIEEKAKKQKHPGLIHKDLGMTSSIVRDLFSPDIEQMVVDSRKLYGEIRKYLKDVSPSLLPKLHLYKEKNPIFDKFGIEGEIVKSLSRKIWLKSGGYCIFDKTEALFVIDVNSGRSVREKDHEKNALKTNLEAAQEIAHQLRQRDIGGIIVIDFIDLTQENNRKKLLSELNCALKKDRAAFDILPMNDFGLVCLTRSRIRPSLLYRYYESCPRCDGLGRVPAKSTVLTQIERAIQQIKTKTGQRRLVLKVHPDMALYLTEGIRSRLRRIMLKFFITIKLKADSSLKDDQFELKPLNAEKENKLEK